MSTRRKPPGPGHQILDYAEANKKLRAGWTQQQVADEAGVTQSAVAAARQRGWITEGRTNVVGGGPPWRMRPEHRNFNVPKMLRCAARMAAGKPVGESNRRALRQFMEGLRQAGAVIHYEPDVAPYFFRVPRREGIDTWLVRDPNVDDRGRAVRKSVSS